MMITVAPKCSHRLATDACWAVAVCPKAKSPKASSAIDSAVRRSGGRVDGGLSTRLGATIVLLNGLEGVG
jgi:hypothetical protein